MSVRSEYLYRNFVVSSLSSGEVPKKEVIKAMEKAMSLLCEEFNDVVLKLYPKCSIVSIESFINNPSREDGCISGRAELTYEYDDEDLEMCNWDDIKESPELDDELNEDLGTCDWDGPEECESCQ